MKILASVILDLNHFHYIVHHPDFQTIPKILETPFVGADPKKKTAPYKFEIEMFKAKSFQPDKIELLKV